MGHPEREPLRYRPPDALLASRFHGQIEHLPQRLEKRKLVSRTLDHAQGLVRTLLEAHRGETTVVDADLAAWLVVHAVNGMLDGAVLGATERLDDPWFTEALVAHVLGAVGATDHALAPRRKKPGALVARGVRPA